MQHNYYTYIVTNYEHTALYCGMTNDLQARLVEHYLNKADSKTFTGKYACCYLLYYEHYRYVNQAIAREKEIKGWVRQKKLQLITTVNPHFVFLNEEVCGIWPPPPEAEKRTSYN